MEYIIIMCFVYMTVLALSAVSGSLIERAGIINLSIEAFLIFGGLNYAIFASMYREQSLLHQIWLIGISGLFPVILGLIYGFLTINLRANQTIAGIALNTLAISFALFVIPSILNPSRDTSKSYISIYPKILSLGEHSHDLMSILNIGLLYTIIGLVIIFLILNKTKLGIKIKTSGENPQAAVSLGMNVQWTRYQAIIISTFFTGIAGAILTQSLSQFYTGNTQGMGFLAVAMVIFGQWRPTYITISSIVFGALFGFINNTIMLPIAKYVPDDLLKTLPYLITLVILVITQRNSKAPKASGIPFVKQGR